MLVVAAHDAGGANILASYLAREGKDARLALGGPAVAIFENRLGRGPDARDVSELINDASFLLTGSGWSSDLEWQAIKAGRDSGIPTATFLDHWVNYRDRFIRANQLFLPDEIWVGDRHAFTMASEEFPGLPIRLVPNPYFLDIGEKRPDEVKRDADSTLRILYAAEPIQEGCGFDEWDALHYFFTNLAVFDGPVQVTLRPHPSDPENKYRKFLASSKWLLGGKGSLLAELHDYGVVAGSHTMALAVGLQLGLRCISVIPPMHGPCLIPLAGIESFEELISRNESTP